MTETPTTATIIEFPDADERELRKIFLAMKKPSPADMIARALDKQAGREPLGMFSGAGG